MILRGIGADPAPGAEGPIQQKQAITFTTGDTIVGTAKKKAGGTSPGDMLAIGIGVPLAALALGVVGLIYLGTRR